MFSLTKRVCALLVAVAGTVLCTQGAAAQAPNWRLSPNMTQAQYVNNMMAAAQASQTVPPWLAGGGPANPYAPGGGIANPYAPGTGIPNPYVPSQATGGYPYMPYYGYIPPAGYFLMGTAQIMNAYPNVIKGNEEARILREQYYMTKLERIKRQRELEIYLKKITPTWSEEQARMHQKTLRRIQTTSNPTEIWQGKALNILLDDLRKNVGKKGSGGQVNVPEEMLKHVNVAKKFGNLGLLRDEGRFSWPHALADILTPEDRKDIEFKTQSLVQKAINGDVPRNILRDVEVALDKAREKLTAKINEISAPDYLEAKRFLQEFNDARVAIKDGDAAAYFEFQRWCRGGKTIQEVVDYMASHGLRFAPAVAGDENAYQAMHSALAAYDMDFNAQVAASLPETPQPANNGNDNK
jgi:hypothetical protein